MAAGDQRRDFFISYTRVDRRWAEWIAVTLAQAGYTTFIQSFDIRSGADFADQMHDAPITGERTIAVLTPAYLSSPFGEVALRNAFANDPSGEHVLLLPILVEPCRPLGVLRIGAYVDLTGVDEATARSKLLAAAKRDGHRPSFTPHPGGLLPPYPGSRQDPADRQEPAKTPDNIDASNAQGVLVGSHGTQTNYWLLGHHGSPESGLEGLSPQVSASKILASPHLDAVTALARAPLNVSADVLRVLVRRDANKVVSLLADLHPDRATELVERLTPDAKWLAKLPVAVAAIEQCQEAMGWTVEGAITQVTRADPSPAGTDGFFRAYQGGHIHWCEGGGAQATVGEMIKGHDSIGGGSGGRLGFPTSAEVAARRSPLGTEGTFQRFESNGTLYRSRWGVFPTWGAIGEYFESNGGTGSSLGFPVQAEVSVGPSPRRTTGWTQRFEGGCVTFTEQDGAWAMGTSFAAYHDRRGAVIGPLGYPVSMARPAGASPAGSTGAFQRFEGSRDLPRDVLDLWAQLKMESRGGCTVYESDRGIYTVASAIAAFYERLGGTTSWLGFPLTEEHDDPTLSSEEWCRSQRFEGGVVFRTGNHRAVAVSAHVMQVLGEGESSLLRRLGRPQSPETSTDLAGLTLQLFANGVVTIKDGTPQVWVRP